MIVLLVMTDGRREYIEQTLASFDDLVCGQISARLIHDDSGDPEYTDWLRQTFVNCEVVATAGRSGFGGAISSAWQHLRSFTEEYVFHLEDDFTFIQPVNLYDLAVVLRDNAHLAQMALRRQPWNAAERAAGGIVEQYPDAYVERRDRAGRVWLEHRLFFTTNPSLYRRRLVDLGWPDGAASEGRFGLRLRDQLGLPWGVQPADVRFGFWGARDSGEWVHHIGDERKGTGY